MCRSEDDAIAVGHDRFDGCSREQPGQRRSRCDRSIAHTHSSIEWQELGGVGEANACGGGESIEGVPQ